MGKNVNILSQTLYQDTITIEDFSKFWKGSFFAVLLEQYNKFHLDTSVTSTTFDLDIYDNVITITVTVVSYTQTKMAMEMMKTEKTIMEK